MVSYDHWELHVSDIKGKMERGELIPDPDWQRGYIWGLKDEQLLIDSILKGLPIPKFYLTEVYDASKGASIHCVVDGQQRLKAIQNFLEDKFQVKIEGKQYRFSELNRTTQDKITQYKLNGHYMRNYKQVDINFLFQRLNSTGIKLTNMEVWNNQYYETNILKMVREIYEEICEFPPKRDYRDYDEADYERLRSSYMATIYTEENIKRMLPLDDVIDLCNCLERNMVEGGGKRLLESFLSHNKNISTRDSAKIKWKFRKTMKNIKQIFSRQDLESSPYSKRTHFISLFLSVSLLTHEYYILDNPGQLKTDLLDFIQNQPEQYREVVLGAIRQKVARQRRVKFLMDIIKKHTIKLDTKRLFAQSLKNKFWREFNHVCQICHRQIRNFRDATLDHKKPWAKGGRTEEDNAQLAHKKCNQEKRDKWEEFVIL